MPRFFRPRRHALLSLVAVLVFLSSWAVAQDKSAIESAASRPAAPKPESRAGGQTDVTSPANEDVPYRPAIAEASEEGKLAMQGFRVPEGMRVELFAAEPLLANPVAFCIDEQGRFYVAETFRQQKGVEDNRNHMTWLEDDLALQTVEERLAMFQKHLGEKVHEYGVEHDRIRLVVDSDGDGKADQSTVFADGFNNIVDGTGAGVLARRGFVYYTCIPDLWVLFDQDNDGRADVSKSLHHGFGVRVAFRGHDMHGPIFGPDGRLYFSIGDRGYNVTTHEGRRLARPDTGAVFRCEPDGSRLEVFAYGLRNPQELAFDDYGNLFTGDNNSDSGDKARWVYLVEGGDSGWRMHYQYLDDRGPFNREYIWHPQRPDQPAYIVPPIVNLADGPSGLVHYPGVGLSERYDDHFFLCDFRGTPGNSGIRSFAVRPKGAGFELVDSHEFVWSILGTDVDFGYDGSLYVSDWVNGWDGLGKGRIYRFSNDAGRQRAEQLKTAQLMRAGFSNTSVEELAELLAHADQRVRRDAQFALSDRGAVEPLVQVAAEDPRQLARLHAIWGLGQLARRARGNESITDPLLRLLSDDDAEVRSQAARVLGDCRLGAAYDGLVELLFDASPRCRFFAVQALGKLGYSDTVPFLYTLLEENNNQDVFIRHAVVKALADIADRDTLAQSTKHTTPAVRMGVLLAMRRLKMPQIAEFLADPVPEIVLEAARAIHDDYIDHVIAQPRIVLPEDAAAATQENPLRPSLHALAGLAGTSSTSDALLRRVANMNFRLGGPEHAAAVARMAARTDLAVELRRELLTELLLWDEPPVLDRVLGSYRPLESPRGADFVGDAIRPVLGSLFSGDTSLQELGAKLAAKYGIREVGAELRRIFDTPSNATAARVSALRALHALGDARVETAMRAGLADAEPAIRAAARRILAERDPNQAIAEFQTVLSQGDPIEQQQALQTLALLKTDAADELLLDMLERLMAGGVRPEIQLDVLEAAAARGTEPLVAALARFEAARRTADPLDGYRECLEGGDVERGKRVFFSRSDASCRRCHRVEGNGGDVGPDLSGIGREKDHAYLLESLVIPNKQIAKGFETAVVTTLAGKVHVGIVREESDRTLKLITAEGNLVLIDKADIDDRAPGISAMPAELIKHLSKSDLRDLVAFLSSLKQSPPQR